MSRVPPIDPSSVVRTDSPAEDAFVTEIPEHLLKRAAERRAAMSGGAAPDAAPKADAPAGDAPAAAPAAVEKKAKATAPLPTLAEDAPKAKPDIAVVAAAKQRKRVPYWAAPVLALLPLWAMLYVYSVQPAPQPETNPLVIGAEVYAGGAGCSGCHNPDGAGITAGKPGQQLNEGHVLETFPDPLDMAHWIAFGTAEGGRDDGTYGDPDREGGALVAGGVGVMPPFEGKLSPEEIAAVVIYIREELSGGLPEDDPNFNVETFEADPEKLAAMVEEVIALGPGGVDEEIKAIDGSESAE